MNSKNIELLMCKYINIQWVVGVRKTAILTMVVLALIVLIAYNTIVTPAQRVVKLKALRKFWSWGELWNGYIGEKTKKENRLIIVGDITKIVGTEERTPTCFTLYSVIIRRYVKANYEEKLDVGSVIVVKSEGGRLKDGSLLIVEGRPLLKVGQRYVLFLAKINDYYVVRDAFIVISNKVYAAFTPIFVGEKSYRIVDDYGNFLGLPDNILSQAKLNIIYDDEHPLYAYNIYGEDLDTFIANLPLRAAHSHRIG